MIRVKLPLDFLAHLRHGIMKPTPGHVVRIVDKSFEVVDHTADIGIVAYGADIKQVFANAALGLFNLMADLDDFEEGLQRELELSAEDVEVLLIEWLNELIYIFDVEHIIFKRFEIEELTSTQVKARCFGEKIKPGQHKLKREIKAATYHMLRISKEDGSYKVQVIFDI
ncbi:MAG: archease [Chloroflexi bacterium]|nr:archease [Chloroflexota bacterium]MBL7061922.1 archease [Dehalococcoidia bacterium]